jgi:Sec-independent protein secretion pathway component TatC
MGLGLNEILLVIVAGVAAIVAAWWSGRRWIALVPLVFLSVAILTPADPTSTLLIALPNVLLMAWAVRLSAQPPQQRPTTSA